MSTILEKKYFIIVNEDEVPIKTENRICIFTSIEKANEYLCFFPDGGHRIISKDHSYLAKANIYLDPPVD